MADRDQRRWVRLLLKPRKSPLAFSITSACGRKARSGRSWALQLREHLELAKQGLPGQTHHQELDQANAMGRQTQVAEEAEMVAAATKEN